MKKFGISQNVLRKEDVRLLKGDGRFVDDTVPAKAGFAVFFRSPVAHAKIVDLDVSDARSPPRVHGIYTSRDLVGKLKNGLGFGTVKNRDGTRGAAPHRPLLAEDTVRFVGEAIAVVVAETRAAALDAMEMITVEFDSLPVHIGTEEGGEAIHPEAPGNLAYDWARGDETAVNTIFDAAAHTTRVELIDNRIHCASIEPRGCFAEWDGSRMRFTYNGQGVWDIRDHIAESMDIDPANVQVVTEDVGGGFGMKAFTYPEHLVSAFAARELGMSVRWMAERSESMLSDNGGRDHVTVAEAAFDENYLLRALRIECVSNLGAYNSSEGQSIASTLAYKVMPGVYDVKDTFFHVKGVFTNTNPVDAYRGAGRPEAIYVIERLMDMSARQLGQDPLDLRRKNFIPTDKFPYKNAAGELYDVGDFDRVLDRAIEVSDIEGFAARKAASAAAGKLRGLGLSYYIESILGSTTEHTKLEFTEDGYVNLYAGTQSNGQGHETVYAQFLHDRAGIPFEKIRFVQGDTEQIEHGGGTGGSRSVTMQGNSILKAADETIERFKPLASEELEISELDLVWENGAYHVAGTDRSVDLLHLADVARARGHADLLLTASTYNLPARSYPNGAHFAEVEVDPGTGHAKVVKYTVVDDFGLLINPMLAEGQVHGGVVQGIGQAVTEEVVFSEEGQLMSGSFMDYGMPRAEDIPNIEFYAELVPSTANEIGMKGCGEAGTVGALAAVVNATLDAVWDQGVHQIDMPLTPSRVWRWLDQARLAAE